MGPFEMVVAIVLIGAIAGVIKNRHSVEAGRRGDRTHAADIDAMQADIDYLKERVRVLEKITTDSDTQLRAEISRLA